MLKQAMKAKLKDVPQDQQDMIMALVEKHPEFFKKIGDEIQAKVKAGRSQQAASMEVMRAHQAELQKVLK